MMENVKRLYTLENFSAGTTRIPNIMRTSLSLSLSLSLVGPEVHARLHGLVKPGLAEHISNKSSGLALFCTSMHKECHRKSDFAATA